MNSDTPQPSDCINRTTPPFLAPFLDGSPLALERVKLAWPALTTCDRATLLSILLSDSEGDQRSLRWTHHQGQIIDLALGDESSYIRYLAARHVSAPRKPEGTDEAPSYVAAKARFEKVQAAPAALIRLAGFDAGDPYKGILNSELDDPASFWKRPQTERLLLVCGVVHSGQKLAALLRWATHELLPSGAVTIEEMLDVLLQYTSGQSIADRVSKRSHSARLSFDGGAEYDLGKSIEALWQAIPDLPTALSDVLIDCLPEEAGFLTIPPDIVATFSNRQLERWLGRDDIEASNLRRALFKDSEDESLKWAALASRSFRLLDSDILDLVYSTSESRDSIEKKVKELEMLASWCRGATLVQMEAICMLIRAAPLDLRSDMSAVNFGEKKQTERAKRLPPDVLKDEVLELRLFALAREVASFNKDQSQPELPAGLRAYRNQIVYHNAWLTYLNLIKEIQLRDPTVQTECSLPLVSIRDFEIPCNPEEDAKVKARIDQERDLRLRELIQRIHASIEERFVSAHAELSRLREESSAVFHVLKSSGIEEQRRTETLEARVQRLSSKMNLLLWMLAAVAIMAFFRFM